MHELPLGRGPGNVQRVSADFSMTTGYLGITFSPVQQKDKPAISMKSPPLVGTSVTRRKNTRSLRWRSVVAFCRGTGDQTGKDLDPEYIILVHTLMGGLLL